MPRQALSPAQLGARVQYLLRQWDDNGDGMVSKKEWRKALPSVGLSASKADLDALFNWLDGDASGFITYPCNG